MSTSRPCQVFDVPERTWRRWHAIARQDPAGEGSWPEHAHDAARALIVKHACTHPAWGRRKIGALVHHDAHRVSEATVLRTLCDEGLLLPAHCQRERGQLAQPRKVAFATEATGTNHA